MNNENNNKNLNDKIVKNSQSYKRKICNKHNSLDKNRPGIFPSPLAAAFSAHLYEFCALYLAPRLSDGERDL
jgi:hypothetical protein